MILVPTLHWISTAVLIQGNGGTPERAGESAYYCKRVMNLLIDSPIPSLASDPFFTPLYLRFQQHDGPILSPAAHYLRNIP